MTDFAATKAMFHLPEGVIYLDGNSLGPLPKAAPGRVDAMLKDQWGEMLITGWMRGGWMQMPMALGDRIGRLIGAEPGHVAVGDTLSIKVYQALAAALALKPGRKVVLSDNGNFPTDLYMASGLLKLLGPGYELRIVDPEAVEAAITERTKALMPVGIFGQTANMTAINKIAAKHGNLPVIEDAAQSFGATHHGKKSCSLSTIGSTSFFPSKPLGGYGDGGALFTDDDDLAEAMRQIRVHGQAKKHYHPILGINGRLDTLQAAIILPKLDIFDDEIAKRQSVAAAYASKLSGMPFELPAVGEGNTSVYAQYTILADAPAELASALQEKGVPSVSYYSVPLHLQPVFAELGYKKGDFPVSENVSARGLSLPMNPYLSEAEVEQVCSAFGGAVAST